ncbi:MAG: ABC transporter permease subunit [Anaerolineae bacterium]
MNWRAIWAVVRRDLLTVARSKGVMLPLILVPLLLLVLMPALLGAFAPRLAEMPGGGLDEIQRFLENMPPGLREQLSGYDEVQMMVVFALIYLFAPLYLILPLMVSNVIAADSFAGEKERKTLEALLYTPTTDGELFLGKVLAAWLPALGVGLGGFLLYTLAVNLSAWATMGGVFFPNLMWIVLVLWVAPAAAGLGLSSMVLISVRAGTFQEAYQVGGVIVVPVIALVLGQATGVIYFSVDLVLVLGFVLWLIDAALLWLGVRTFRRSEIIARL